MTTTPFLRPVRESDFDAVHALAVQSGGGMTNLPADPDALRKRIHFASDCFAKGATKPGPEIYTLVLEIDGKVVGTAAVFSQIGLKNGFINYRINKEFYSSSHRDNPLMRRVLIPTHDFTGRAEVGQLFISPDARGGGMGKLLARARYMFIAQKPEIVADHICAELRGWRDPDGTQPFWDAVGRHFFEMEFEQADAYNSAHGNQFIEDLLPRYPIYAALLPKDARDCLGRPHENAEGAYKMLIDEGFAFNDYIDVFDGGPLVDTKVKNIRTVRDSRTATVSGIADASAGEEALLASGAVATYRCCRARAIIEGDRAVIDAETAAALNIEKGAGLRWAKW